jgi:hypothetical protein
MLGLMEKQLESKNIPYGYALCFNESCPLRDTCLHYQAYLMKSENRLGGPYYRYHHGDNKLSPSQQADIMAILAKYGSTDGLSFDHYETDWDFD